jgi:UDP-N-acetylglucosamine--N-acetylmuramyl-(pentapeptide) pyrophosphoryl-undecaprenol N-acetylglucosamine transferase
MNNKRLFVIAAGSGGHILPALQLARQWASENKTSDIYFFTGTNALEKKITSGHNNITHTYHCNLSKFSLHRWWTIPLILTQFFIIFCKGLFYSIKHKPDRIISTGGHLSIPLCIAGWLTRRPIDIYELNYTPGKAIKALMPFANAIHIVFAQTKKFCRWGMWSFSKKCIISSFPLRFTEQDRHLDHEKILTRINTHLKQQQIPYLFEPTRKTIFVLGGSQGSQFLNKLIKLFIAQKPELHDKIQIIHQIGSFEENTWNEWYTTHHIPALTFSYDERVHEYYTLADVIICRAGAGTMFEIAFFGKPCIVIPLVASTTSHQIENARAMAEQYPELFTVLEQALVQNNATTFVDAIYKIVS